MPRPKKPKKYPRVSIYTDPKLWRWLVEKSKGYAPFASSASEVIREMILILKESDLRIEELRQAVVNYLLDKAKHMKEIQQEEIEQPPEDT